MTDNQQPTNMDIIANIQRIVAAGGPAWYAWCDLDIAVIHGRLRDEAYHASTPCLPACEAAVIAWALDLCDYISEKEIGFARFEPETPAGRVFGRWSWRCYLHGNESYGYVDNKLAACTALIAAVAAGLGEEC